MPLVGNEYRKRSEEDILSFLEAELRDEYGEDIDLTESSAFRTFAEALAALDANDLEDAMEEVHQAGFLEDASGENLDRLLKIIGVQRQSAIRSTGIVRFSHGGTVSQTHNITNGLIVQTDDDDPVEFETTELVTLHLRDDFEDGSLDAGYNGDTGDFSVVDDTSDPTPKQGDWELKCGATSGSHIYKTTKSTYIGKVMDCYVYADSNTIPHVTFGVTDANNYYRVVLDTSAGSHKIEELDAGSPTTHGSNSVTIPNSEWLRVEIDWGAESNGSIKSRIYDASGTLVDELEITGENTIEKGGFGFESGDATGDKYWDWYGDRSVEADARAVNEGTIGNVGANTLTQLPTVPSDVNSVTNPYPMGDTDQFLTNLQTFTVGQPEEDDDALRDRAQISEGTPGDATIKAILAKLSDVDGVESITLFENKTDSASGGLQPHSFEAVIYGTSTDQDIADALFEVKGFTAWDQSGVNGSAKSETVEASNGQEFTMNWSEPTEIAVDMTLDIVHNDEYVGDDAIRDKIIDYIGGTGTDGTSVLGTDVGENVFINQIEDVVVGPEDTGVIGVDSSGTSYTPSTTTDSNGLEIISISSNEVAVTNGEDGSITINTTEV